MSLDLHCLENNMLPSNIKPCMLKHFLRRSMALLGQLFFLLLISINSVVADNVYLIVSADTDTNQRAANLIGQQIKDVSPSVHFHISSIESFNPTTINADDLLVTIGNTAAIKIINLKLKNPQIFSFNTQDILPSPSVMWSSIVLEQPLERLISVTPSLLTHSYKKQILLPVSTANTAMLNAATKVTQPDLVVLPVPNDEKPAKQVASHLFKAGALIAVKDNHIWRGDNARWMLYQAYRNNVPVVGYSKKFLKAGALVAVYSTLEQITSKVSTEIIYWDKHHKLNKTGTIYSNYNIEYNNKIARSLKISTPNNQYDVESEQ